MVARVPKRPTRFLLSEPNAAAVASMIVTMGNGLLSRINS